MLPEQGQYAPPPSYAAQGQPTPGYGQPGGPPSGGPPRGGYGQPTGQWPPQPPAPKKSRKWPWFVGGAVLLVILIAAIGGGGSSTPTGSTGAAPTAAPSSSAPAGGGSTGASSSAPASSGVVYEVTGSGRATSISYGSDGGISQANGERLPWTESAEAADGFGIYSLTAQSSGSGEITCRITVDGEEIARQTSRGQYAVVSCSGTSSGF